MPIVEIQLINYSGEELIIFMSECDKGIIQRGRTIANMELIAYLEKLGDKVYSYEMHRRTPQGMSQRSIKEEYERHHRIKFKIRSGMVEVQTNNYCRMGIEQDNIIEIQEIRKRLNQLNLN